MTMRSSRSPVWKTICETLMAEISQGLYRPGDKLPTESQLAGRFGVNRHTIRRALAALGEAGTVHARRGSGVFVMAQPADYPIGRRVRFQQNIAASGRTASRRFSRMETRPASPPEAEALGLSPADPVHVVEGVSMADGQPLALFRSVFSAQRFPDLLRHLAQSGSITAALLECGLPDYTRVSTRITAKLASPTQALALQVAEASPVLRSEAVNADPQGRAVEYGMTWFAGDRVTLTHHPDQP